MRKQVVILHNLLDKIKSDKHYLSIILRNNGVCWYLTDNGETHFHFLKYYDEFQYFQIKKINSICEKYDFVNKELYKKVCDKGGVKKFANDIKKFLECQSKIYEFIFDYKTEKRYYKNQKL